MNIVFFALVAASFLFALLLGRPEEVGQAALQSARGSVDLALGLIGYIALFLGLMKVVEAAGGLAFMARLLRPLLQRLFPDIPADHPALGAMLMNVSANALGLGNAATPFGLKAMKELQSLNPSPETASNAMVLFLALNTSGLALLPTGMIALRALHGSADAAVILPTTLVATGLSTLAGVSAALLFARLPIFRATPAQREASAMHAASAPAIPWTAFLPLLAFVALLGSLVLLVAAYGAAASAWILPTLILGMLSVGVVRRVRVYETFVEGAREGFDLAIKLIPYLVAILVAVGMFRASGGLAWVSARLGPLTEAWGMPAEVLPVAFLRPLSGSGAFGVVAELVETHGPDGLIGLLATTMNGSTDTTFYVLAVYFGAVGVTRARHAVAAGLSADIVGVLASVITVHILLGALL